MKFNPEELRQIISSIHECKIQNLKIMSNSSKLIIHRLPESKLNVKNDKISSKKTECENNEISIVSNNTKIENISSYTELEQDRYFTIISPMVGTFYRSSSPNDKPFIEINEIVKANQTVCIIEAMKLMNEIEAEITGKVTEILVENGDIVDCGQALIRVRPV